MAICWNYPFASEPSWLFINIASHDLMLICVGKVSWIEKVLENHNNHHNLQLLNLYQLLNVNFDSYLQLNSFPQYRLHKDLKSSSLSINITMSRRERFWWLDSVHWDYTSQALFHCIRLYGFIYAGHFIIFICI